MSNLVEHAKKELELLGEEPATVKGYLDMIQIFADMGHSGGSASEFIPTLNKLLNFENLKPLTANPDEWEWHGKNMGEIYQNRRNPKAMSWDGGKTYWLVDDQVEEGQERPIYESEPFAVPFN